MKTHSTQLYGGRIDFNFDQTEATATFGERSQDFAAANDGHGRIPEPNAFQQAAAWLKRESQAQAAAEASSKQGRVEAAVADAKARRRGQHPQPAKDNEP